MILAITGGTGFVGSHLIDGALAAGHHVHALARRPQAPRDGVEWIAGALDRTASLDTLVAGADAVVHVAGVVNAPDRAGFSAGNVDGTAAIVAAASRAGVARFVHVSSLAAREPGLSAYGWSKAGAEKIVTASDLDWSIVRPPAIFGPRDTEMLELFRIARYRIMPLPPAGGRMSLIYVEDLARLLRVLATGTATSRQMLEPDDGMPGGWDHRDVARAIGGAVGTSVLPLSLPRPLLRTLARADIVVRGARAKLTSDRVAYFCHPDWTAHLHPPAAVWTAQTPTTEAMATTVRWYRQNRLL
ncbi:NAD(P)-dependent oxidoreductase [Sphingomonas bacterium]|uniref:NAD-dependent epimerase/dehydratase family protein n=1 Tax=Sphingomonas bacterium TaxID=1895847 RepID=UPI0020C71217|nr:NAD(P)H-binding protein [Sphingomonas bacterium]